MIGMNDPISWLNNNKHRFSIELNGYEYPPMATYVGVLSLIDRGGKILDIGAGNGMQLKFIKQFSPHDFVPYGVEKDEKAFKQSIEDVFCRYANNFKLMDIIDYDFADGPFNIILANPFCAYPTYDIVKFTEICLAHLSSRGRLIYEIHSDVLMAHNVTDFSVFQKLGMKISRGLDLIFCILDDNRL